ncbi:unnamed protein product [Didymodactylos carnosus]|uniref:Ig-like domain-containing protein n=1 Tax=Didymodactylos carnosus TaxID=1234261 RepID=A0A813UTV6_9BILA|nr:unnamed protein product [Didymodactylos carnosus]CAF0901892.1 unnamed protein product [Didymodactylos carnosus]CAF3614287.1 unnamed protein product [Didymodactylos carnosus]CAF3682403.1 unnamed protein product [Didymodactylos carnosus]
MGIRTAYHHWDDKPLDELTVHSLSSGQLQAAESPQILSNFSTKSPIIVNEGANVTLICHAKGRPHPYITWYRRGNKYALSNGTQFLVLHNVSRAQSGHYECVAHNGVNGHSVSKDIELRVICEYQQFLLSYSNHRMYGG